MLTIYAKSFMTATRAGRAATQRKTPPEALPRLIAPCKAR